MGRVTRKQAAEIADKLHVDEDAVLEMNAEDSAIKAKLATPEHGGRSPLGEIEPNSAESKKQEEDPVEEPVEELKKSTRGRKAGKKGGAKGKKNNLAASTTALPEDCDIVPDDNESAPSPASEKAAEEVISPQPEGEFMFTSSCIPGDHMTLMQGGVSVPGANVKLQDRSHSPPSEAVRLTRSQLSKKAEVESEPKSLVDGIGQTQEEKEDYFVSNVTPTIETSEPTDMSETATTTMMGAPASPLPSAVPNVVKNLRTETPAKRSTSNKENVVPESDANGMASSSMYDALEDAVVSGATPPRSEAHTSPRPEDPIAALDDLEDAVENVSRGILEVQDSPMKKQARKEEPTGSTTPAKEASKVEEEKPKIKREKAAPVVRTTKASQARLSMAQNKDAAGNALGRPRQSTTLGRSTSVRQSVAPKAEGASKRVPSNPITSAAARTKSLKASTDGSPREKKETVIPHSKPRPISLSFPTPPPAQKSTKATTSSSFQLPGEAVAAKLKAAREARMAREAEKAEKTKAEEAEKNRERKVGFKARPAPKSNGEVPSVRQTNASRARESIMAGKPAPGAAAAPSHKRSNTVAHTDRPRVSLKPSTATTAPSKPRPSTSLANMPKTRPSLATKPAPTTTTTSASTTRVTSTGTGTGASKSTSKGKEVFARAANAKAAEQKAKEEKEAAAKRARAQAAERGRVASREWAEKQKLRKMGVGVKRGVEGRKSESGVAGAEASAGAVEGGIDVPAQAETVPVDAIAAEAMETVIVAAPEGDNEAANAAA